MAQLNTAIDDDLKSAVDAMAAEQRRTLRAVVEMALEAWLVTATAENREAKDAA